MSKVIISVDSEEIKAAIQRLDDNQKWAIARQIINQQFQSIVRKFRQRIRKKKFTSKKLNQIIERAREEFYAKSRHRH